MSREYKKIKHLEEEILELQRTGYTYRQIGEKYGYTKMQVKSLVKRYRNNIIKITTNSVPNKRRGRPRKAPITSQSELELEINRLRMENDLLRNFLQSIGRR